MSTFVSVGNATQPFDRLLAAVDAAATQLPQPVVVQAGSSAFTSDRCRVLAFLPMEQFEQLVAESELLILHAGAGSVMHAVRAGKIPVVMARKARLGEHVDDHQEELARELERAGRVVVAERPEELLSACIKAKAAQSNAAAEPRIPPMIAMVAAALADCAKHGRNAR